MTNGDGIRMVNAQLRYYMHVSDPDSLDDAEWAMLVKELEWIRNQLRNYLILFIRKIIHYEIETDVGWEWLLV